MSTTLRVVSTFITSAMCVGVMVLGVLELSQVCVTTVRNFAIVYTSYLGAVVLNAFFVVTAFAPTTVDSALLVLALTLRIAAFQITPIALGTVMLWSAQTYWTKTDLDLFNQNRYTGVFGVERDPRLWIQFSIAMLFGRTYFS